MRVDRIVLGPLEANCWVVSDDAGGPALVIDPAGDAERVLEVLDGRSVAAIVLTHGHFDHLGGVEALIAATGAALMVHELDAVDSMSSQKNLATMLGYHCVAPVADRLLCEGDSIAAGELLFTVLHTPGHTPGGICLFAEDPAGGAPQLFSGDTLFAGSVGRSDFGGGDGRALSHSIAAKLAPLPGETVVHPGHGPNTTISRERQLNQFFPRA
ncbi:MAG: MBL fold metallo-hydrolase [Coriobacteriia bacterium]|nr:MBL fold metallo-hydrolase [Coriobacteriia bacterium]